MSKYVNILSEEFHADWKFSIFPFIVDDYDNI